MQSTLRLLIGLLIVLPTLYGGCTGPTLDTAAPSSTDGSTSPAESSLTGTYNDDSIVSTGSSGSDTTVLHKRHNPEPGTMLMFGIGLAGIGAAATRRKFKKTK